MTQTKPTFLKAHCRRQKQCDWRCLSDHNNGIPNLCNGCERHRNNAPTSPLPGSDLVVVTINDVEVQCAHGTRLIDLLWEVGIDIPTLCYHPLVTPAKCGVCVVDIQEGGKWKETPSCDLVIFAPLTVRTNTPVLAQHRAAAIKRVLEAAPKSSAIQALAQEQGVSIIRSCPPALPEKDEPTGPPLQPTAPNHCILCERCIQICSNLNGKPMLLKSETGSIERIDDAPCQSCGACIAVCLTDAIPKLSSTTQVADCRLCELICPELAITTDTTQNFIVDSTACKSCGLCEHICPENAIKMVAFPED